MKQKILLINKSLVIGGIETILLTQYSLLKSQGHNVNILLFSNQIEYDINNKDDIFYFDDFKSIKSFFKEKEKVSKYNLIISHAQSERISKKIKSIKKNIIFVIHGMHSNRLINGNIVAKFLRKYRIKKLYKNQNLISVSNAVKKDMDLLGVKAKKHDVIYNPFDINNINDLSKEKISENIQNKYIVWVGNITNVKNLPLLLKIYKGLCKNFDLVIVGNGDEKVINKLKKDIALNLESKIHFLGAKNNPYPYIKNASAMLLTSKSEGLPTVLIESLILKTPVFGVDILAINELLTKYFKYGLLPDDKAENMAVHILDNIDKEVNINKVKNDFDNMRSIDGYLNYFSKT